jgi:hypothetical protein
MGLTKKHFPVCDPETVVELIRRHFSECPLPSALPGVYRLFPRAFPFVSGRPLEGIIAHLTKQIGGNVHDRGLVAISASTTSDNGSYHAKNAAGLTTDDCFESTNTPSQWICYAFNGFSVRPTHYTIVSARWWTEHPANWVLQGSNDNSAWLPLDRRSNNDELNGNRRTATFTVSSPQTVRMVRIYQTGPNHGGSNYLTLAAFELFGSLGG